MMEFLHGIKPVYLALICTLFTWGLTALGAATVFFFKKVNKKVLNTMVGFASGVMIAASFFSLLLPAFEISENLYNIKWLRPAGGFLLGGLFVIISSICLDKFSRKENVPQTHKRSVLLVGSITLHNIPEGMCIGVAFGLAGAGLEGAEIAGALLLSLGIGLQNFPEGAAVSLPLHRDGASKAKSFLFGQASGIVEPVAAMLGFVFATSVQGLLPLILGFSAGAMVAVAASELLPEAAESKNFSAVGCVIGFVLMMVMDVALG